LARAWPLTQRRPQVQAYRNQVRAVVEEAILKTPLKLPITWESPFWAILMGIEHERIHFETSSVLIRQLPLAVLKGPHPFWARYPAWAPEAPRNQLLPVNSEPVTVRLGVDKDKHNQYGWDNEYGEQTSVVPPFKASKFLVSNQEFLAFYQAHGYQRREFWTDEGWRWATFKLKQGVAHPRFWVPQQDGSFKLRLMLEEIDMPWDWPVEVNNLEAKAFCNWLAASTGKSIRLPTEDEYEVLRMQVEGDHVSWERAPGNLNMEWYCSPTPVTAFPPSPGGFHDIVGNVWQHTETPIDAFRGFQVHPLYDDFSVPTFDLQHNLIKGGSWISTGNEANRHSRYAFRRHFFQHAGFRYVETARKVQIRSDLYERDDAVAISAHFNYGPSYFGVSNFQQAVAQAVIDAASRFKVPSRRVLDIGCATGRSTFELARHFEYALGLDFSARFIRKAVQLQEDGVVKYLLPDEGDLETPQSHTLDDVKLTDVRRKAEFFQADACNLDPRFTGYDVVLASNLIEELYDPALFLRILHERINTGGLLVLASTYRWDERFTPKDKWLGGFVDKETGQPRRALDTVRSVLKAHFKELGAPRELPFVIRETSRVFKHAVSEVTFWQRL
jgi:5-histidylcysteine sulfoxide synthase/putative 4-mercaptohistidine N1-methyltranferase